ncbi:hypothetical protein STEG23_008343, partial [Scotinomys teguina]
MSGYLTNVYATEENDSPSQQDLRALPDSELFWREHIGMAVTASGKDFTLVGVAGSEEFSIPMQAKEVGTEYAFYISIENKSQQMCLGVMTVLSDFIRHFNPSVLMPMCSPGKSGAAHGTAEDLWIQAKQLVRHLKENQQLDFQNDWKLITVFFSNTNQCHLCPSAKEVPRAFVNLVDLSEALAISHQYQETGFSPAPELCNCSEEVTKLSKAVMQWSYQETWQDLLASSKFNKHESFTVVFQPFFFEIDRPWERSSPQDPSMLALGIWNSMMKPVGHKDEIFDGTERRTMKCPSQESPYLFTYRNSNYQAQRLKHTGRLQVTEGTEFNCPDKDPSDTVPTTDVNSLPKEEATEALQIA